MLIQTWVSSDTQVLEVTQMATPPSLSASRLLGRIPFRSNLTLLIVAVTLVLTTMSVGVWAEPEASDQGIYTAISSRIPYAVAQGSLEDPELSWLPFGDVDADGIDDRLEASVGVHDGLNVVVSFDRSVTQHHINTVLALDAFTAVEYKYHNIDAVSFYTSGLVYQDLEAILNMDHVTFIEREVTHYPLLEVSVPAMKVRESTNYSPYTAWQEGALGDGVVIAVLDTGVDDLIHESLRNKFVAGVDLTNSANPTNPNDGNGHGTHCASTALGSGGNSGTFMGVAPNSSLVDVKISTVIGVTTRLDDALDWCIDNQEEHSIDVVSISYGSTYASSGTDATSRLVNECVDNGMVVCVAMGNDGSNLVPSPAAADKAISVGALDDKGTISRNDDSIAGYSNYGPRNNDGDLDPYDELKPDVTAPGTDIHAARHDSAAGYIDMSGTSMACPHVAGMAACFLSVEPSLTPEQIKQILHRTAQPKGTPSVPSVDGKYNYRYGWGMVDGYGAVRQLKDPMSVSYNGPDALAPEETGVFSVQSDLTRLASNKHGDSLRFEVWVPGTWDKPRYVTVEPGEGEEPQLEKWGPLRVDGDWRFIQWVNYTTTPESDTRLTPYVTFNSMPSLEMASVTELDAYLSLNEGPQYQDTKTVYKGSEPDTDVDVAVQPQSITFSEDLPAEGSEVTITATVSNNGTEAAYGIAVSFIDGPVQTGRVIQTKFLDINPGISKTVSTKWQATPGRHTITVFGDSEDKYNEGNENNNTRQRQILVTGFNSPPQATLRADPKNPILGQKVTFDGSASEDTDPDEEGAISYYKYTYGDGKDSGWITDKYHDYYYKDPGNYLASLIVKDNGGLESTNDAQVTITVTEPLEGTLDYFLVRESSMVEETPPPQNEALIACPDGYISGPGGMFGTIQWANVGTWTSVPRESTIIIKDDVEVTLFLRNTGMSPIEEAQFRLTLRVNGAPLGDPFLTPVVNLSTVKPNIFVLGQSNIPSATLKYGQQMSMAIECKVKGNGLYMVYDDGWYDTRVSLKYGIPNLAPPSAYAGEDMKVEVETPFTLYGIANDTDGNIINYEWDTDGDGVYDYNSTEDGNYDHPGFNKTGNYRLLFKAKDDDGLVTEDVINISVKPKKINQPPNVFITNLEDGKTVSGLVTVNGSATDDEGVTKVEYTIGGDLWKTATGTDTWTFSFDSWEYENGGLEIKARSSDGELMSPEFVINVKVANYNALPEIVDVGAFPNAIQADGASQARLTAEVYDDDGLGDISSVKVDLSPIGGSSSERMYDDGTRGDAVPDDGKYSVTVTAPSSILPGKKNLVVTVTDKRGEDDTSTIQLTIDSLNDPPKIIKAGADPPTVLNNGINTTIVYVDVSDDQGLSDIWTVTADLTSLGGSGGKNLLDDGSGGDKVAGDGRFSAEINAPANIKPGDKFVTVTVMDLAGESVSKQFVLSVLNSSVVGDPDNGTGANETDPMEFIPIIVLGVGFLAILIGAAIFFVVGRHQADAVEAAQPARAVAKPATTTAKPAAGSDLKMPWSVTQAQMAKMPPQQKQMYMQRYRQNQAQWAKMTVEQKKAYIQKYNANRQAQIAKAQGGQAAVGGTKKFIVKGSG